MGQKVSPIGLRVGVNRDWSSTWFADKKKFAKLLYEDNAIRNFINKKYHHCSISSIDIDRTDKKLTINIRTAKVGVVVGKDGGNIEVLKKEIAKLSDTKNIYVNIKEVKQPDGDAVIVAENIAIQLENRVAWRRAVKSALSRVAKSNVKGVKIMVSGRLDGAEIARSETFKDGSLPLHSIKTNVDYGTAEALTTFGIVGVKVWINKGDLYGTLAKVRKLNNEASDNNRNFKPRFNNNKKAPRVAKKDVATENANNEGGNN